MNYGQILIYQNDSCQFPLLISSQQYQIISFFCFRMKNVGKTPLISWERWRDDRYSAMYAGMSCHFATNG